MLEAHKITPLWPGKIHNIPANIIGPTGDIAGLLHNIPDRRAEDFRAWVNVGKARHSRGGRPPPLLE